MQESLAVKKLMTLIAFSHLVGNQAASAKNAIGKAVTHLAARSVAAAFEKKTFYMSLCIFSLKYEHRGLLATGFQGTQCIPAFLVHHTATYPTSNIRPGVCRYVIVRQFLVEVNRLHFS